VDLVSQFPANPAAKGYPEERAAESAKRANDIASGQADNELSTARHRYEDAAAMLEGLVAGRQPNQITDASEKAQFEALACRARSAADPRGFVLFGDGRYANTLSRPLGTWFRLKPKAIRQFSLRCPTLHAGT
jgi:hypothetical protein